jgi:uncharacterized DUF497 family protein
MYVTMGRFRLGDLQVIWDPAKAAGNVEKHGIAFEEAATTWLDPFGLEHADEVHSGEEDRCIRIGASLRGALLVVWSTDSQMRRRTSIRIIGARRATRRERQLYEQGTSDREN